MAECFFSASGKNFDVDRFLKSSAWKRGASVSHKGDKTGLPEHPRYLASKFTLDVVSEGEKLDLTLKRATKFCKKYDNELQRLKVFPGVEEIELHFLCWWYSDTACSIISLPPSLLSLAVRHNIGITASFNVTSPSFFSLTLPRVSGPDR